MIKARQPHTVTGRKVVEFYRQATLTNLEVKSEIFKDLEFYIVNTDDSVKSKPSLERLIAEH